MCYLSPISMYKKAFLARGQIDMSQRQPDPTHNEQPLLPYNKKNDRPLFMVLVILAFLAALTLLAVASGNRATAAWHNSLAGKITVQLKPSAPSNEGQAPEVQDETARAVELLKKLPPIDTVIVLPSEYAKKLLEPWLGNVDLPDDLPLPVLLELQLKPGQSLDIKKTAALLENNHLRADIDDHRQWDAEIKRTTNAPNPVESESHK